MNNPAQSVSGSAGRKVKDLPLDRVRERGKIPGKTAPDILGKVGSENPWHRDSTGKESDKNTSEKRAGLDLKSGKYCSVWFLGYTFCYLGHIL